MVFSGLTQRQRTGVVLKILGWAIWSSAFLIAVLNVTSTKFSGGLFLFDVFGMVSWGVCLYAADHLAGKWILLQLLGLKKGDEIPSPNVAENW